MEKSNKQDHPRSYRIERFKKDAHLRALGFYDFPYRTRLSFVPLIRYWKKKITSRDAAEALLAHEITRKLDDCMEFLAPVVDDDALRKHWDFVELIIAGLVPLAYRNNKYVQIGRPFSLFGFYQTPPLRSKLEDPEVEIEANVDPQTLHNTIVVQACINILNTFYGQRLQIAQPVIFTVSTKKEETRQHLKSELNIDFLEIKKLKPLKAISQETIKRLVDRIDDLDLWLEHIPPDNFEFHGLVRVNMVDVTQEEALSRIKRILLEKDAVMAYDSMRTMENHLKDFFSIPGLRLGLKALDYPRSDSILHKYKIRQNLLKDEVDDLLSTEYAGSVYEIASQRREEIIVHDLHQYEEAGVLERLLIDKGIRSLMLVPLVGKNEQVIGMLELASPRPFDFNNFTALRLEEIRPLFRTALVRSRREIDNEIEAIIRDHYTALHPSVEWKFIEKAFDILRAKDQGEPIDQIQPVLFKDVYPLYGQADIVGSTKLRNQAIRADLMDNLERLEQLFGYVKEQIALPLVDQQLLRVSEERSKLAKTIFSTDEFRIIKFLQHEIYPFVVELAQDYPQVAGLIRQYIDDLDDDLHIVSYHRKAFEQSVRSINKTVTRYLDEEEKKLQEIIPHYFERYVTDGVQYDIYIGQSLLRRETFSQGQLRNLRLWQLIAMCEITRRLESNRGTLPVDMTTAQLILVHSTTLSIRFRLDEKRFDVDGAFNIRYPLLKKRIDKATLKDGYERLTQSGHVAIVYAQEKDREEYEGYLDFLMRKDYIESAIEYLDLADMQDVYGMKALRVKVKHPSK